VPKVVDRERRRGDLARAAARVVARIGLEGVTIQAVAAEAGCSAGSIAHYFRTKDDLLVHALRAVSQPLIQLLHEASDGLQSLEALRGLARRSLPLDAASERDWRVRLAFWTRASGPPEEVQLARQHLGEWRALWEAAIRAVQANGAARSDFDAREASCGIVSLIIGTAVQLLVRPRSANGEVAGAVESYLRSFARESPG
jgi:AcrR family transcriptional regulator